MILRLIINQSIEKIPTISFDSEYLKFAELYFIKSSTTDKFLGSDVF